MVNSTLNSVAYSGVADIGAFPAEAVALIIIPALVALALSLYWNFKIYAKARAGLWRAVAAFLESLELALYGAAGLIFAGALYLATAEALKIPGELKAEIIKNAAIFAGGYCGLVAVGYFVKKWIARIGEHERRAKEEDGDGPPPSSKLPPVKPPKGSGIVYATEDPEKATALKECLEDVRR